MSRNFSLTRSRLWRTRAATALAAAGALVMSGGLVMLAAPTASATNGNNGTIKIGGQDALEEGNSDNPDNEPFVDCQLLIQWYNYTLPDESTDDDVDSTVNFELWDPTQEGRSFAVNPDDSLSFSTFSNEGTPDYAKTYQLAINGAPMKAPGDKHGYHIKVTVNTEYSQGSDVKHKVFWYKPCQPNGSEVRSTESRSSCAGGVEERTKVVTRTYVWSDEAGWVLGPEVVTYNPDWHKVRDLTPQERAAAKCDQPGNITETVSDSQATCELGYRSRTGTVTKEYVWNGNDWVLEPAANWSTVWGDWSAYRPLTDAEFAQLDCRPDQPIAGVEEFSDSQLSCDNGYEERSGTRTTTYAWNEDTRVYDPVVGDIVWGDWEFVRDLTEAESAELRCEPTVLGSESVRPKPHKTRTPVVLGTQAVAPTAVNAGLTSLPTTGSSSNTLLAQLMVGGGMLLLLAGGWLGFGRREYGAHQA